MEHPTTHYEHTSIVNDTEKLLSQTIQAIESDTMSEEMARQLDDWLVENEETMDILHASTTDLRIRIAEVRAQLQAYFT